MYRTMAGVRRFEPSKNCASALASRNTAKRYRKRDTRRARTSGSLSNIPRRSESTWRRYDAHAIGDQDPSTLQLRVVVAIKPERCARGGTKPPRCRSESVNTSRAKTSLLRNCQPHVQVQRG